MELLLEKHGFQVLSSYHSTRHMTVRHLVADWGILYLPPRVVSTAEALAKRLGLWERVITVDLSDIVAVIARKPV